MPSSWVPSSDLLECRELDLDSAFALAGLLSALFEVAVPGLDEAALFPLEEAFETGRDSFFCEAGWDTSSS